MVISELVVAIANLQRPARRKCCQLYVRPPMHLATYLAPTTIMHCLLPSDMDTGWNVLDIHRITSRPPKLKRYDPLLIMTSNLAITGLQMEARIPHATRGWSQRQARLQTICSFLCTAKAIRLHSNVIRCSPQAWSVYIQKYYTWCLHNSHVDGDLRAANLRRFRLWTWLLPHDTSRVMSKV